MSKPQYRQNAYQHLSELITQADDALNLEPENEDELRQAMQDGEDLLTRLDDVEYQLIEELRKVDDEFDL